MELHVASIQEWELIFAATLSGSSSVARARCVGETVRETLDHETRDVGRERCSTKLILKTAQTCWCAFWVWLANNWLVIPTHWI